MANLQPMNFWDNIWVNSDIEMPEITCRVKLLFKLHIQCVGPFWSSSCAPFREILDMPLWWLLAPHHLLYQLAQNDMLIGSPSCPSFHMNYHSKILLLHDFVIVLYQKVFFSLAGIPVAAKRVKTSIWTLPWQGTLTDQCHLADRQNSCRFLVKDHDYLNKLSLGLYCQHVKITSPFDWIGIPIITEISMLVIYTQTLL